MKIKKNTIVVKLDSGAIGHIIKVLPLGNVIINNGQGIKYKGYIDEILDIFKNQKSRISSNKMMMPIKSKEFITLNESIKTMNREHNFIYGFIELLMFLNVVYSIIMTLCESLSIKASDTSDTLQTGIALQTLRQSTGIFRRAGTVA